MRREAAGRGDELAGGDCRRCWRPTCAHIASRSALDRRVACHRAPPIGRSVDRVLVTLNNHNPVACVTITALRLQCSRDLSWYAHP